MLEKDTLKGKSPEKILEILGKEFENSREQNDIEKLKKAIKIANSINLEGFDNDSKSILYYFIGNAWSYIQRIKYPKTNFEFDIEELELQVKFYRKSLSLLKKSKNKFIKCQVLTNLGNLFNDIGRIVEAQEYFNLCLNIDANFGMALGNKGFSLFHYAKVIFEPVHQFIFLQYSRKNLLESIQNKEVYPEAKNGFYNLINHIESAYPTEELDYFREYDNFYKDLTEEEILYRKWCVKNTLFINSLNDILTQSVVANDFLCTPSITLKLNEKPIYQEMYNQLKQEFVSARYIFYESLQNLEVHFSDKGVILMDTMDNTFYSIYIEKMKVAFRLCYSIFDKISYLLNEYLNLNNPPSRVSFRKVWYKNLDKRKGLNEMIINSKNWSLRGLFWLSKDLYDQDFEESIEPEAKEIAKIRNYIEHKSFKIVEKTNKNSANKITTYEIQRIEFKKKTLKLLKLSRSALMYLSYLIYQEENKRNTKLENEIILPLEFLNVNDKNRI
ncbi:Tetratricopeptide repeat protein [Tenacibaculum maritimum]|uniref:LA2681 family HEPN domain-containing protein n=1 Tax=Tenacibaculum maritimum TaxID=107401 RepID=UPI0012E677BD|nr:LA2681 family HEPN domain-containing protein [Tenacibaculum maritimum]CAA0248745.1 Tetratricopeptide repeat protein [Tenacibaculum maritimum]